MPMKREKLDSNGIPILSRDDIEVKAEKFLQFFDQQCLKEPVFTPLPTICTTLREKHNVKFVFDLNLGETKEGYRYLGRFHISSRTIFIDNRLSDSDPRFNFTLAHELGHFVLHKQVNLKILSDNAEIRDTSRNLVLERIEGGNPRSLIEWQANKFASSLLLPRYTVPIAVMEKQKAMGITRDIGKIYFDRQAVNLRDYNHILAHLKFVYQTSAAAIKIRLKELNVLVDHTDYTVRSKGSPELTGSILSRVFNSIEDSIK